PEGSTLAVKYFIEYLAVHPEDVGVRWLLNLAYMTLGKYPQEVPEKYLFPLTAFQSDFDVGRFRDVASKLGLDRLSQAGGAIMDDFDNDGLLDVVQTSWEDGVPIAFHRNKGDGTFEDRTRAAGLDQQTGGL